MNNKLHKWSLKKKNGWGPPYFQLWQEKTLEVRGGLIAIKIEERASRLQI